MPLLRRFPVMLTRTSVHRGVAIGLLLAVALGASACEVAAGETRRGPEPFRPVGDAIAAGLEDVTFPWSAAPGSAAAIGEIVQTAGDATAETVTVKIVAGGTGVSLRSDCTDGARAGGAWVDNTSVDVTEYGSGRCQGWTRVTSGSQSSWVRDEYLQGLPAAENRTTPGVFSTTPGDPALSQLREWTTALMDGAGRVALLSRHSPGSTQQEFTLKSLEELQDDMRVLATGIGAAAPATNAACAAPRRPTIEAANTVGELAKQLHTGFAQGAERTSGLESLAGQYVTSQKEAARLIAECSQR
ncbi:MAG: hypothetical protein IT299_09915 [Dehalococcoidia bacterium]|nr:hypothetical protein [Dehalococcoidia bacterium]